MESERSESPAASLRQLRVPRVLRAGLIAAVSLGGSLFAADGASPTATFKQYCFQCHGEKSPMGGVSLVQLTAQSSLGESFQHWTKIADALESKHMPPPKMPQPTEAQRQEAVTWIRAKLDEYAQKHAGDPGRVTVRRLTSGEYYYTVKDLTGLDLKFGADFGSDGVGGEGFANYGDVQFMADASLERYLETANRIASHAVLGAGPLGFYEDPGKSGFELSAISRIKEIYSTHGFSAASGEGGRAYGMDKYARAFYAAWAFRNRAALGEPNTTLAAFGAREGLSSRFVQHIWTVLQEPAPTYPSNLVIARWKEIPAPTADTKASLASARSGAEQVQKTLTDWPRMLFAAGEAAAGGQGDERAIVLTDESLEAKPSQMLRYQLRAGMRGKPNKTPKLYLNALAVNPDGKDPVRIAWRNGMVRYRGTDRALGEPKPLVSLISAEERQRLGIAEGSQDIPAKGDGSLIVNLTLPDGVGGLQLQIEPSLIGDSQTDAVVRCTVSETADAAKGSPMVVLLGHTGNAGFQRWKANVLHFGAVLPLASHTEAAPSDKDPIPPPYNNTYNQPERDDFHIKVKYYRSDDFLREKMLDDATRAKLDHAWNDLYASFGYHNTILNFIAEKYKVDFQKKTIDQLTAVQIAALPAEPRKYVQELRTHYDAVQRAEKAGEPGHIEDAIRFAGKAWRRPLTPAEKTQLRNFYTSIRQSAKLDHRQAIRAVLTRVLVSPSFLYRLEQPSQLAAAKPVSNYEMASRLSYFLWSSMPDDELLRAAGAGELTNPQQLAKQTKRMLADPKARRLSTEFFGQWLGFYRFDQFKGVDTSRFPEFTEPLKAAMYDEAVSFFEHIVRKDRPIGEMLYADYTFLNEPLAKFYDVKAPVTSKREAQLVEGAKAFQRGGMFRLGAVLTATSAPLRTSPVKRGDWVLRRVLGTPTPPPPADAGTLPSDDKAFGGLSLREKLAAHQRNASCAGCHSRIDPMGVPLERYDAVGRWRDTYSDGKPIDDSSVTRDKQEIAGVEGLLQYMKSQEPQVLRNFANKMLGFALGRTVQASDQPLIDKLVQAGTGASISQLASEIVTSKQFRYRRGREEEVPSKPATPAQPAIRESAALNLKREGGR